jgi:putative FmdB family regulatory protein
MAIYEYQCRSCGEEFSRRELIGQHASSHPTCPKCGSDKVEQQMRSINVVTSKKS